MTTDAERRGNLAAIIADPDAPADDKMKALRALHDLCMSRAKHFAIEQGHHRHDQPDR
jgi:hypothetical protein